MSNDLADLIAKELAAYSDEVTEKWIRLQSK